VPCSVFIIGAIIMFLNFTLIDSIRISLSPQYNLICQKVPRNKSRIQLSKLGIVSMRLVLHLLFLLASNPPLHESESKSGSSSSSSSSSSSRQNAKAAAAAAALGLAEGGNSSNSSSSSSSTVSSSHRSSNTTTNGEFFPLSLSVLCSRLLCDLGAFCRLLDVSISDAQLLLHLLLLRLDHVMTPGGVKVASTTTKAAKQQHEQQQQQPAMAAAEAAANTSG
jgi:hypothetical protein